MADREKLLDLNDLPRTNSDPNQTAEERIRRENWPWPKWTTDNPEPSGGTSEAELN